MYEQLYEDNEWCTDVMDALQWKAESGMKGRMYFIWVVVKKYGIGTLLWIDYTCIYRLR